ncbi:MAG: hypothetical protein GX605_08175 [Chloroflexi bacterium]|nr:hypothetical protein [Chloroflexota bacterium]
MEEELNLWEYLRAVVHRWPLVLAGMVLALAAMVAFWALQPPQYEATATLLVSAPRYDWRFDTSILSVVDSRKDWKAEALGIAKGYDVMEEAVALARGSFPGSQELRPAALTRIAEAKAGPEGLLHLTVTWATPEGARALANAWAQALVARTQELYGNTAELAEFQKSLAEAQTRLQQAEEARRAYQGQTGLELLRKGFEGVVGYSADERQLDYLSDELALHQTALANITLMLEESRRIAAGGGSAAAFPWQLAQTPALAARGRLSPDLAAGDAGAAIRLMEEEQQAIAAATAQLAPQVEALQDRLAEQNDVLARLTRERDLAADAYSALSMKVQELEARQVADLGSTRVMQQAERAQAVQMRLTMALLLGGGLGLLLGVIGALLAERLAAPGGTALEHDASHTSR